MPLLGVIISRRFVNLGYALGSKTAAWVFSDKLVLNSLDKLPITVGSAFGINNIKCNQAEV